MRCLWILVSLSLLAADKPQLDKNVFGEIRARTIGPATMSGRITDIDCPSTDPNTIYVGTAGGGVWKSKNGGLSFESIFDDYIQSIGCVTVDPNAPETVWVGTGEINTRNSVSYGRGLYKTTDGGKNWKLMGFEDSERIGEVRVHPNDSDTVYVAVLGHLWGDHDERGLYKTTDGGESWKRILHVDEKTGCIDVDLDPQEPDTVYAAMWQVRRWPYFFESGGPGSGLYKSSDGGESFKKLSNGLPKGLLGRIDLDIAQSRPNRIYAIVEAEETGLYRSDDLGESWKKVNAGMGVKARPFYLSTVKVDPKDHNRVYNPSFQLGISKDGGESFPGLFGGFGGGVHPDIQAIWIDPQNPKRVIIGTDGGIYISDNAGAHFLYVASLPVSTFYRVSTDDQIPYHVYGGLQDNGSWYAPSAAPGGIANRDWTNLGGGDGFCVFADGEDPQFVYWEMQGGVLFRLDLTTNENKNIVPYPEEDMEKNRFNWNAPFQRSPTNPKTIYFGSQYLFKSQDKGDSWTRISPDLTTDDPEKQRQEESGGLTNDVTTAENHCTLFTIAESPLDENLIWVGTDDGNVQVTRDGGKNWQNVVGNIPDLPAHTWCSSVHPSAHHAGTVYATFDGHRSGDKTPYVYKSEDFGATWRSLASEDIDGHCHIILQDPESAGLLFLGTELGLFVSFDDGGQWVPFRGNLPPVSVRDMVLQERERDLVVATHGRGIYILDDITPLRHLTQETLKEKFAFLPSREARTTTQRSLQDFQGDNTYVAGNPQEGVNINYYLSRRHIFGDLKLEIYDPEGKLIKTLPGGKRKGINRVYWGMRLDPPKAASARSVSLTTLAGSFVGPMVPEGTYRIKLIKGKDTHETEVVLLPNRLNKHSAEDRALQHQTVLKLYNMQEDVSFTADRLLDLAKQCEARAAAAKGGLAKRLTQRVEDIKALRATVLTDVDSIFVDKLRLRDELVVLYAAISGYGGRPGQNQLAQVRVMEQRLAELNQNAAELLKIEDLNKRLRARNQEPLTLLDRDAWQKESATQGGGLSEKAITKAWYRHMAPIRGLVGLRP